MLPLLWVVIDYIAVLLAEQLSFSLRNALITNSALHISWLSFHVIGPAIFILFMQVQSLYTRRMQFWRIISHIFKANLYAVGMMIFLMYVLKRHLTHHGYSSDSYGYLPSSFSYYSALSVVKY